MLHQYIVICTDPKTGVQSAFETDWYDYENHYNPEYKEIVIDLYNGKISFNGKDWQEIEEDHL